MIEEKTLPAKRCTRIGERADTLYPPWGEAAAHLMTLDGCVHRGFGASASDCVEDRQFGIIPKIAPP